MGAANTAIAMQPVAKATLESLCVQALNHVPRARQIHAVQLARPRVGDANWTLDAVTPAFHVRDVKASHAVIRELQQTFRMVC